MVSIPAAFGSLRRSLSLASDEQVARQLLGQAERIRELQQQALEEARKDPSGDGGRITLLDYYREATAAGVPIEQMFNFSNMDLRGMDIRAEDITAINKARQEANPNATSIENLTRFDGSKFYDVVFRPCTTFNDLGIGATNTVSISGGTFVGMEPNNTLTLGTGNYKDIRFENINGGTLELGEGAQVHVVTGRGASMRVVMGERSVLSGFTTQPQPQDGTQPRGLSIIDIQAAPGARIAEATLTGATLSPSSSVQGVVFENVAFNSVNLAGVDFLGAEFRDVTLNGKPATFETLQAAGVAKDQLPASIDGSQHAAIAPQTPQQSAMAAARGLLASGACVTGGAPDGNNPNKALLVTAEARACIERDNQAFAAYVAALAARNNIA
jgi:hypothetical protein